MRYAAIVLSVILLGLALVARGGETQEAVGQPTQTPLVELCLDYETMMQGEGEECRAE